MVRREGEPVDRTRSWERTIAGSTVRIRRQTNVCSSGSEDINITYRISIPTEAGGINNVTLRHNTTAEWTADLNATGVGEADQVLVTAPDGTCYERLPISCGGDEILVHLPDATVESYCWDAITGNERAAQSLVQLFASPVRIPLVCGVGLDAETVASLLSTLAEADVHARSRLHAYRYALIRGALISSTGFSIDSKQSLEIFIQAVNAADAIGSINIIDVATDFLATTHRSAEETSQLLQRLGYDVEEVLFQDSGRLLCSFLANDVLTQNLRTARGRAMESQWQVDGSYEQRKAEAESHPYEVRAQTWRELVCTAARESPDEFAYVLTNAFYWSGEVSRSDARTHELLLEASETVATAHGMPKMAARAAFKREIAAGHRLRSQHCFEMAHRHFATAQEHASNHSFLREWQPVYNAGVVSGHASSSDGDHETAVTILDQTIEAVADYDLNPDERASCIRHLEAQKRETQAKQTTAYDERTRAEFLDGARDRYETLEFERSVDRIERRLETIQSSDAAATGAEVESTGPAETDDEESSTDSTPQTKSDESSSVSHTEKPTSKTGQTPSPSMPSAKSSESEPARPDVTQYPHKDPISPSDHDEMGSIDPSVPSDEQDADGESNNLDDPYIF